MIVAQWPRIGRVWFSELLDSALRREHDGESSLVEIYQGVQTSILYNRVGSLRIGPTFIRLNIRLVR